MGQPGKKEWSALYQAAITFKEAAPWEWLDNEDLIAIENPANGEVGYCSILGNGGQEFGLGIFIGNEGYENYLKLTGWETDADYFEIAMMSRSITMLLTDRETLEKRDRDVIRSLNLRFRGRNAWPFFRSQQPGYIPWFLEKGEATFLTTALQQALVVAEEVRGGKLDLVEETPDNRVITRYYRDGVWNHEWRSTPISSRIEQTCVEGIDTAVEANLYLLQSQSNERDGSWELDMFLLPMPIGAVSEKPHYPICFLAVDCDQGAIVGTNLTDPWLTSSERMDEVIQLLSKARRLPVEIRIKSDDMQRIVEPIANRLGIKLSVSPLSMLEQTKESLFEDFFQ